MTTREATESDIPAIVNLLRLSLGESSSPKSTEYWNWKHINNPFGKSPVIVAEENGTLIGVRAFMRWKWQCNGESFPALRAVDTATHPAHQGKGIFKKLTLALVGKCASEGDAFIFNTPNTQSKPGYLKMGWRELGRIPVKMKIVKPVSMLLHKLKISKAVDNTDLSGYNITADTFQTSLFGKTSPTSSFVEAAHPRNYLTWRYAECPIKRYFCAFDSQSDPSIAIVFYVKDQAWGRELRICEVVAPHPDAKAFQRLLKQVRHEAGVNFISVSEYKSGIVKNVLNASGFLKLNIGPAFTFRPLRDDLPDLFYKIENWQFAMGDMELF